MASSANFLSGAETQVRKKALADAVSKVLLRVEELALAWRSPSSPASDGRGRAWAQPEQSLTFRAEVMPGRDRSQRTFRVSKVLNNFRVLLEGMAGEHSRWEFELRPGRTQR